MSIYVVMSPPRPSPLSSPPSLQIHELPKTASICTDFLYFRQMLARSRSYYDDNIAQRLNMIDTKSPKQCRQFWEILDRSHQDRREKLLFCMEELREQLAARHDSAVLRKEVSNNIA